MTQRATRPRWPTPEEPGRALIGLTGSGTYGIVWRDFPAMERRGGYSGPYPTLTAAQDGAREWAAYWELDPASLVLEEVADLSAVR